MRLLATFVVSPALLLGLTAAAHAQALGTAPAEEKAIHGGALKTKDAPKVDEKKPEITAVTLQAGGLLNTGNSKNVAGSAGGTFELRRDSNGLTAGIIGNYGLSPDEKGDLKSITAGVAQGRLKYDRYFSDRFSGFFMTTGRYDYKQGVDFRLNLDPGAKYLLVSEKKTQLGAELGYDFQYDVRSGAVVRSAGPEPTNPDEPIKKTAIDHSARGFLGLKHAFSEQVNLSVTAEFLQSFVNTSRYRFNTETIFAAKVSDGFSFGVGFTTRFDNQPAEGKTKLDTTTTFNLIYAFTQLPKKPEAPKEAAAEAPKDTAGAPCGAPPPPPAAAPTTAPAAPALPAAPAPTTTSGSTGGTSGSATIR